MDKGTRRQKKRGVDRKRTEDDMCRRNENYLIGNPGETGSGDCSGQTEVK